MENKTLNIPTLPSKVDSDVRRAFAAVTAWFNGTSAAGGIVTASSLPDVLSRNPATEGLFNGAIPPQIQNLVVTGAFGTIILSWDDPRFKHLAYVEVVRNTVDDLGTAQKIGTTVSTLYADTPPNASASVTYYYWVRPISKANIEGPYNATAGTPGHTATDPEYALEVLTGQLTASQLHRDVNRILDSVENALPQGIAYNVIQTNDAVKNQLKVQSILSAKAAANYAAIEVEQLVRASTIAPDYSPTGSYGAKKCVMYEGVLYRNTSGATISNAGTWTGTGWTAITVDLYASYGIKLDVNGKVAGFAMDNDGTLSKMIVSVDEFAVARPVQFTEAGMVPVTEGHTPVENDEWAKPDGSVWKYLSSVWVQQVGHAVPIAVLTSRQEITPGVWLDPGVYIDGASINNLSVRRAAIALLAVDSAQMAEAAVVESKIADGAVTNLKIGDTIQSTVYVPGSGGVGWLIDKAGTIRGQGIIVEDASITTAKIGEAAVDTLRIAGGAVTSPTSGGSVTSFSLTPQTYNTDTWTTVLTVSVTITDEDVASTNKTPFHAQGDCKIYLLGDLTDGGINRVSSFEVRMFGRETSEASGSYHLYDDHFAYVSALTSPLQSMTRAAHLSFTGVFTPTVAGTYHIDFQIRNVIRSSEGWACSGWILPNMLVMGARR